MSSPIQTYDAEHYTDRFIDTGEQFHKVVKPEFRKFFVVRIEDMIRLMKLPVPPARIGNHTLLYLTEGEATMTIGSETYTIYKDECLIVPAGQVFSIGEVDVDSGKGYLCNFQNDSIVGKFANNELLKDFEFLQVWGNPLTKLGERSSHYVQQVYERILDEYTEHGIAHPDILQPYLIALLCEINAVYKPVSESRQTNAVLLTNGFRELLFEHVTSKHLVTDYAALLHISPNHLNKSVKTITGKSPTKWIDEAIVLEAKVLLHQSKLSVSEVAAAVGFYDASYFSRLFRKYEGMTPMDFRKRFVIE